MIIQTSNFKDQTSYKLQTSNFKRIWYLIFDFPLIFEVWWLNFAAGDNP